LASHQGVEAVVEARIAEPAAAAIGERRSSKVRTDIAIPAAPYLERKVREVPQLAELWSYINPYMLYGRHLGYKGNFEKALTEHDAKALELFHNMEEVKREAFHFMKVKAVWQFFHPHLPLRPAAPRRRALPQRLYPGCR